MVQLRSQENIYKINNSNSINKKTKKINLKIIIEILIIIIQIQIWVLTTTQKGSIKILIQTQIIMQIILETSIRFLIIKIADNNSNKMLI